MLLVGVIALTAGLMIFPALTLGPDRRRADAMIRTIVGSAIAVVVLTLVFGFGYPLLMTGFAQVAFQDKANGSLITLDGKVVGSKLAAQGFTSPRYFHERPSATAPAYNAGATTFANLGPTNQDLAKNVKAAAAAILKLERPYNPGLDDRRHPRRRGHDVGLGHRPAHLARLRASCRRAGSPPSASCRSRPSSS